jgi:hypothetical protein
MEGTLRVEPVMSTVRMSFADEYEPNEELVDWEDF